MKFIIDECVGTSMSDFLKNEGYDVCCVFSDYRGISDTFILDYALKNNFIIVTSDKDFGEMIFKYKKKHCGVILIRCIPNTFIKRIDVMKKLLTYFENKINNNFIVVTNNSVRIIEP